MVKYEDIVKANRTIKMTDVGRGKEYAEVPQRIKAFRMLYPNGSLTTEIISIVDGVVIMKATACDENGQILGTGHAYEKEGNGFINKTSYIENCETSAWGRALAACGIIGGNENDAGSIASMEEVLNAQKQQMKMSEDEINAQKQQMKMSEDEKKAKLKDLLQETGSDVPLFLVWCTKEFQRQIDNVDVLLDKELDAAISMVSKKKEKK